MKKVILFFATGTEECEALITADILRRAGAQVTIAAVSNDNSTTVTGSHGITIVADASAQTVNCSDADMIILPGGLPGTTNLAASKTVTNAIKAQMAAGKYLAAICAAPSILAPLGLLTGRTATAHAAFQDKLDGATVQDAEVVVDGNLITSYGLGGAIPFALCLTALLYGNDAASKIKEAIAYRHA